MITPELVQRLGFDSYASNIIANLIEDGNLYHGYQIENDDYTLSVTQFNKRFLVTVRAYVPTIGWESAEIVI
jgi:hypothetical protein